ncbi:Asp-tRNA(Asn)/Glu-tRNA(Gln) amidotransferase subunit GatB [Ligilactobacillus salivarius]|jgi:aspartyl-tRNA(Asn)/glutamyl-tRNA(Gln) amidotransferase subunit B|uniref:Aspartyl/glutamyl-tRNA(Asn/Gln) amidotransferase subunit B n=1 Tax=Ligilactobacillus salivarius (strain UCC118) TaxID=362948 RepID=GATB_LIGS1|nr:Asp-tRNA(Asn)/Glu-tRNA(Gln) amidotransferase subunit GatB [Ligilactobacillus salivarius]Q1WSI0.1 RecName: Full=Aspartyl/glutamyl-tRNA(Asn/Gln) amidotransferase subunit B; Short=Asp/Glu-ADT subunit B [Ligilactobacillus salivarius UCC118]ABE00149.1 Aspartyl/glutamyl-tRNA(Asn/Gln) amidotransferase subunit B [Ligilactobacillus salivarius UCC118]OQQ75364.1 aspartyl/glutamyl-tRNA(Asn/Gln) amidotransferase subunit B [Ligilactobacillus salivarius]OQR19537.1 aspartyl/glutamyl-tRNA(Asn/Gln) amidotrans
MNFETTVGLEVHIEMQTNSKAYSPSPVQYGAEQNTNTNVIDWGYPGVLPEINKGALEFGMRAALALHCDITQDVGFDRKNYFYPDNPKAYQITQARTPIGTNGWLEIELEDGTKKKIGIREMHVEEDAGKNTHNPDGYSYVDLNRQGTPLIEIVAEPDISSADEAYAYLTKLRQVIQFTGISDVKMEEGSMRADVNVSIAPIGSDKLGVRTEMKNLNSFEHVRKGIQYEVKRQERLLMSGGEVEQETRRFDEPSGETILMRSKEEANDYRYFPEPDLPPIHISDDWIEEVRASIPEMPDKRRERYTQDWGIPAYDAGVLTQTKEMSDFYDATVAAGAGPKLAANWLMGEVNAYLNSKQVELSDTALTPEHLATMIKLIEDETISSKIAKKVFKEIITNDTEPKAWVESKGMVQLSDPAKLQPIIDEVLDNNEQSIEDFKNGKDRAIGFLVGQIMKKTRGMANPKMVNKLLMASLKER